MAALLHIRGSGSADEPPVIATLRARGFDIDSRLPAAAESRPFEVAMIAPDVEAPLQVARTLRGEAPDAHIVFLTTPSSEAALRRELPVARIGTQWSIAPADEPSTIASVLRRAFDETEKRRKLRRTLDRINSSLTASQQPVRRALISDHFLATVLDQLLDAVVVLDPEGLVLAYNAAAATAFGEIRRGASFAETLPPEARDAVEAASRSLDGAAESIHPVSRTGAEYGLRASSLRDEQGAIIGMAVVARDMTGARSAEKHQILVSDAVRALASTLDAPAALQRLADVIVSGFADLAVVDMVDGSGMRRYAAAATSAEQRELIQQSRVLHESFDPQHASLAAVLRGETLVFNDLDADDLRRLAVDDEHSALLLQLAPRAILVAPLRAGAETMGAIGVARSGDVPFSPGDVESIEELARQATTALQNIWSYHAAAEASRLKDEFLATLSHELRTPMTSILGWAQMLQLPVPDADLLRDGLASIERSAKAQAQLIDDLLDVSQLEMGKLQLQARPFDLTPIVAAAIDVIRPAAQARSVTMRLEVSDEHPVIAGDPDRMQQVIWNLLSNAVKFSGQNGEVCVSVGIEDGMASVVVADRGRGIDAAFLPHVFERFRQADSRASRRFSGLGLGLSIVKQIVEMHGGTATASSPGPGKGSTFRVLVPLASPPDLP